MLKQDPMRVIIFDPKKSVSFEGNTGPYLLYSYARAKSILRKVELKEKISLKNLEEKEYELISYLNDFKEIIQRAYRELNPSFIANYTYELSQKFNEFYHSCPVINSENEVFRLNLVKSFSIVLKNSLNLLGIDVLEKM
jgi:arginyl-tRNA synthetase